MDPLQWLRERWAEILGLSGRLDRVVSRAHAALSDQSLPRELRERAADIWAGAVADRAELARILRDNVREQTGAGTATMQGLGAFPVLVVVGGVTAVAVAAALAAIFGRASAYERELDLIATGTVTVDELDRIRREAPAEGGVAGTLREASTLLRVVLVVGLGYVAWRTWGRA